MDKKDTSLIYEINTRVWLKQLSVKNGKDITLVTLPEEEIKQLKKLGFDAVWLMGVWRSSKKGREIALNHEGLYREFLSVLSDLKDSDISCSPYSIAGYELNPSLGSEEGIIDFRNRLHKYGMKLILDFVPNHVAIDHPWIKTHPEYFISGSTQDICNDSNTFFLTHNNTVLAYGKDPYFSAWTDVAQLNYFNPKTRKAMQEELVKVANLCDGVRCDMAMLILNRIQKQIWGERVYAGNKFSEPQREFWQGSIAEVKKIYPDFLFIAEVYWGLEDELISLGFDYVYDKVFYDALKDTDVEGIRKNLTKSGQLARKRLRFIENHDESRAAAVFDRKKSKTACLLMLLTSGAHLIHYGQMEGFTKKLPVQLTRMPNEEIDQELFFFYEKLLLILKTISKANSQWTLSETFPAWEDNLTFRNFFVFSQDSLYLAVINYSQTQSQCYVHLDLAGFKEKNVLFKDLLGPAEYIRSIEEIAARGLYLDIPAYAFHLFKITGLEQV
jgi:glycosidase